MKQYASESMTAWEREHWDITVYQLLGKMREEHGDRELFSYQREGMIYQVSYGEFVSAAMRLARYFDSLDLTGKYIVIDGRNTYEQLVALFAVAAMGGIAAPLCFDLDLQDLQDLIARIHPALVVFDREDEDILDEVAGMAPLLACTGPNSVETVLAENGAEYQDDGRCKPNDPALLLATSGSTSRSKLVLLPHYALLPHSRMEAERSLFVLPMYHAAGLFALVDDMAHGIPIGLSNLRQGILDLLWFLPRDVFGVPSFVALLVKRSQTGYLDLSSFCSINSGGAPQDMEQVRYLNNLGIFSMSLYGATETSGTVTCATKACYRSGAVGKPSPWNQVCISDQGEILVKGSTLMLGYLDDPEASQAVLQDGWYHTGDIGYLDEDGFLFITGRIKNIIILSNGENVSPEAVESKLTACQEIWEVVVCGENDRIVAHIWCAEESRESVCTFIKHYNRTVPSYCRIGRVVFRDTPFTKTASGKIKR